MLEELQGLPPLLEAQFLGRTLVLQRHAEEEAGRRHRRQKGRVEEERVRRLVQREAVVGRCHLQVGLVLLVLLVLLQVGGFVSANRLHRNPTAPCSSPLANPSPAEEVLLAELVQLAALLRVLLSSCST